MIDPVQQKPTNLDISGQSENVAWRSHVQPCRQVVTYLYLYL